MKLLIAEDENRIREGLKKLIPWHEYGIDTILIAKDGQEAFDICMQSKIDILFTDIRMPHMNGIELAQHAKELYPDLKIIFFSSHTDKEYLKAAIRIHAASYIEKPLKKEDLLAVLQDISMSRVGPSNSSSISPRLALLQIITQGTVLTEARQALAPLPGDPQNGFHVFILQTCDTESPGFTAGQCDALEAILLEQFSQVIITSWNNKYCGLVWGAAVQNSDVFSKKMDAFSKELNHSVFPGIPFIIACSEKMSEFDRIYSGFQSACQALTQLFLTGYNNSIVFADRRKKAPFPVPDPVGKLEVALHCGTRDDSFALMNDICQAIEKDPNVYDALTVRSTCLNICLKLNEVAKEKGLSLQDSISILPGWSEIASAKTFADAVAVLFRLLQNYYSQSFFIARNPYISEICQYVDQQISNCSLCVKLISDHIGLTANHVSHLFKKEMGEPLSAYITNTRIKKASQLLLGSNLSLSEISSSVGYSDANYFIRMFKKSTGFTPTEYRNQRLSRNLTGQDKARP